MGGGDKRRGGGVLMFMHGRSGIYGHRPLHPYSDRTEHVGFSSTRQTLIAYEVGSAAVYGEGWGIISSVIREHSN